MTALGLGLTVPALAQPTVDWSGLAYLDYAYTLDTPDSDAVGDNAFDYRRLYLTADVGLGGDFSGRARLEANSTSTTAQGRPAPYVKDLWARWAYSEAGHRATVGVQPPPVFDVTESVWGYRSLEKTLLDRGGIRDSRDFGVRLDGPLGDTGVYYSAMVANGNGVRAEDDGDAGKRAYAQLAFRPGGLPLRAVVNADAFASEPEGVGRLTGTRVSAFLGAVTERFRGGVEGVLLAEDSDDPTLRTLDGLGVSVFGALGVATNTTALARYDYLEDGVTRSGVAEHYVIVALAQRLSPGVQVMPNVIVERPQGTDATVTGRVTLDVRF